MDIVFEDIVCQITPPTPVGSVYDILPVTETRCGRRTSITLFPFLSSIAASCLKFNFFLGKNDLNGMDLSLNG